MAVLLVNFETGLLLCSLSFGSSLEALIHHSVLISSNIQSRIS